NSSSYGISSLDSSGYIARNDFINNNPGGSSQGYIQQIESTDNIIESNYWNNWIKPDNNNDSIVDKPYNLSTQTGYPNSFDYYPITTPSCFNPPVIIYPRSNLTLDGIVSLEWEPAELYGFKESYNVSYSPDNGTTWNILATDITTTSYIWDTSTVNDGMSYLIKITVIWDIEFSYEAVSSKNFVIKNIPIEPTTISDIEITTTILDDTITWVATSSNASTYTIYLDNNEVANGLWVSGENISYDISMLTPATYNVTLVVTDEMGTSNTHSMIITVPESPVPETTTVTVPLITETTTTTVPDTTTSTEIYTSTDMITTITTILSQIVETMTKTTTGLSLVVIGLGFLGIIMIRRKNRK
ncbi:MAG: hypothetical protein ACFFD1_06025, partial [Candidatus Thorarchaeota archaeon]